MQFNALDEDDYGLQRRSLGIGCNNVVKGMVGQQWGFWRLACDEQTKIPHVN